MTYLMSDAPELVAQLVERFDLSACGHAQADRNRDSYLAGRTMNEERICRTNEALAYDLYGLTGDEIRIAEGKQK